MNDRPSRSSRKNSPDNKISKEEGFLSIVENIVNRGNKSDAAEIPDGQTQYFSLNFNFAAAICYFPIALCILAPILWLYSESDSNKYLRFHSVQGLILAGIIIAVQVILGTIRNIAGMIPGLNLFLPLLIALFSSLVAIVWSIICLKQMINVFKGKQGRLPLLAEYADRFV